MTPLPYVLKGYSKDGRLHGTLSYGADVVADTKDTEGCRSTKDLQQWARTEAATHKASISPRETFSFENSFVL